MPLTITLKDRLAANVVFTETQHNGNTIVFTNSGSSLLARKQITLSLRENAAVNRIVGKLSVPTVGVNPGSGLPVVSWTEIGSFDLGAVRQASVEAADDFIAMFGSLATSPTVKSLFTQSAWTL